MSDHKAVPTPQEIIKSELAKMGARFPNAGAKIILRELARAGVAVTALPELSDIPEPVMARFDRLPFSMRMRVAADVMDAVNERHRREYPTAGISANEPISPSSMRYLADFWQQADAAAVVSEGETHPEDRHA